VGAFGGSVGRLLVFGLAGALLFGLLVSDFLCFVMQNIVLESSPLWASQKERLIPLVFMILSVFPD